jgi:predicted DCC family thiol-disulfide oxidoreductase YuxK
VLLYDRDCGLCRTIAAAALALARPDILRPLRIQSEEARRLLPMLSEEQRLASFHLVALPSGRVSSAGAGLAELAALLPGARLTAPVLRGAPRIAERAYRLVAGNRERIGRCIPQRLKDTATRRIDDREGPA